MVKVIKMRQTPCFHFLQVLHTTFEEHTFLMNGLIQGVKVIKIFP